MKKLRLLLLLLLACPLTALHAQELSQFGFAGDRENTFVQGTQNSIAIWKQWCALHAEGDVEGIVARRGIDLDDGPPPPFFFHCFG